MSYIKRQFEKGYIKVFDGVVGRYLSEEFDHEFLPLEKDSLMELYNAGLITRHQVIKTEQAGIESMAKTIKDINIQNR